MTEPAKIHERLLAAYGPQPGRPGDSPFEKLLMVVLRQSTSEKNVERALANLREQDLLDPRRLYAASREELEGLLKPAGNLRLKLPRLRNLLALVCQKYEGSLEQMFQTDGATLREELLATNGIGPETADAILLYAGNYPTFVVDVHTHRVLKRHGWIESEADYHTVQDYFHASLERDPALFRELHAMFVKVGQEHCGKRASCSGCPLESLLPPSGIYEPEW